MLINVALVKQITFVNVNCQIDGSKFPSEQTDARKLPIKQTYVENGSRANVTLNENCLNDNAYKQQPNVLIKMYFQQYT